MSSTAKFCHHSLAGMNSVLDLVLIGVEDELANEFARCCRDELVVIEKLLSRFDPESETFKLNRNTIGKWVPVSNELWSVIQQCEQYREQSMGYFNIALGYLKQSTEPTQKPSPPDIRMEPESQSVLFGNGFTSLDFGAVGKGLFLQKLDCLLTTFQVEDCFASFGGSSVLTRGKHPSGDYWPLSLREGEPGQLHFKLNNHAVSISSVEVGKGRAAHIFNPNKLEMVTEPRLAFVKTDCPVEAEVLSTALLASPPAVFEQLSQAFKPEQVAVFFQTKTNKLFLEYEYTKSD
ncbi:MAG: FAD:protein FMN transferase [Mangrovibacterium sp.]